MLVRTLLVFALLTGTTLQAQEDVLFEITRNKDRHKIIYYLNLDKEGNLDQEEAIGAFWRRFDESGSRSKSLNALERKYAYGIHFLEIRPNFVRFRFVSYDKRDFILRRQDQGPFAVFTEIRGKEVEIENIHLHLAGGTFWFPKISAIELHGKDQSGKEVVEVIHDP